MSNPKDLLYSKSQEWVKFIDGETVEIGLTDYAQNALGDLVFVNLCEEGEKFGQETVIGDVESIKAVSDIFAPIECEVTEVNGAVLDDSSLINSAPYEAWLIRAKYIAGKEDLLSAKDYEKFIETL